ncbi:MAG: caspase family protein, partial [Bacteroidota bacterium]
TEATYTVIVKGFDHFNKATANDQCLLFYAGHGTRLPAPAPFLHEETSGKNEAFVCYPDPKSPRRFLLDKELSYLIWRISKRNNRPFVSIVDSCFAKGIYRNSQKVRERYVTAEGGPALEDYLGYEEYQFSSEGHFKPFARRQLLLAAADEGQTSKESYVFDENDTRGVFTYRLQKALADASGAISYQELINRVCIRVGTEVLAQTPVLEATEAADEAALFLGTSEAAATSKPLLAWYPKRGWAINRGALHGIFREPGSPPPQVQLISTGTILDLTEVRSTTSSVLAPVDLDRGEIHPVRLLGLPAARVPVAIAPDADPDEMESLKIKLHTAADPLYRLVASDAGPEYLLHAKEDSYYLTPGDVNPTVEELAAGDPSARPLFARVRGYGFDNLKLFVIRLQHLLRWHNLLALRNPAIKRPPAGIRLTLECTTGEVAADGTPKLTATEFYPAAALTYHQDQTGKWHPPAFRLRVHNDTGRKVYVSVLYLSDDYAVNNRLMKNESIPPEGSALARYVDRNRQEKTVIPVGIPPANRNWRRNRIKEYLKLIVATEPFVTDGFAQPALPQELAAPDDNYRGGEAPRAKQWDWFTREICLEITHPGW